MKIQKKIICLVFINKTQPKKTFFLRKASRKAVKPSMLI